MAKAKLTPRPYAVLGRKIRKARETLGISQENFAPKVGTTRRHLIRIEAGKHRPGDHLLSAVARETGTPVEQFTNEGDDEMQTSFTTASSAPSGSSFVPSSNAYKRTTTSSGR